VAKSPGFQGQPEGNELLGEGATTVCRVAASVVFPEMLMGQTVGQAHTRLVRNQGWGINGDYGSGASLRYLIHPGENVFYRGMATQINQL
jgi:hypothetical protein